MNKNHTRRTCRALFPWLFLLMAGLPSLAQHPNHPLGVNPSRNYQMGAEAIDQVDLFSGSLSLTIPIGPFFMVYNSNVWRYQYEIDGSTQYLRAELDREATGGLGWHLGWGEVYSPTHWYNANDDGDWLYVDRMGAHHIFHDRNLHEGEDSSDPDVLYTRDGSYLRLKKRCVNGCNLYEVTIEFPDGTTMLFDSGTSGWGNTYHLHKIWGPISSESDPDFTIDYDRESPTNPRIVDREWRTVTDRWGRVTRITLSDQYAWINRVVTQVDIQTFDNQHAIYDFTYEQKLVSRSCKDNYPGNDDRISVPFLTEILLPDGSTYSMKDSTDVFYDRSTCPAGPADAKGTLTGINLPTGGAIRWTYMEYVFPPGTGNSPFNSSAGVQTRQLYDHQGNPVGNPWRYRSSSASVGPETYDREIYTEVIKPDGSCSKHFFNGIYTVQPAAGRGWERTLPFVWSTNDGDGKYLSRIDYDAFSGNQCAGNALRSTYVHFRHDTPPGGNDSGEWARLNQTIDKTRTVYHDDGDRHKDVVLSDFNGLGSFRNRATTGTFWSGSQNNELRENWINRDPSRGTYPGTYVPVTSTDAWRFGDYDVVEHTELDAVGVQQTRMEVQFDADGFKRCERRLEGTQRGSHDLVTVYFRNPGDPNSLVTDAKYYGGELQTLATTGPDCGIDAATLAPERWVKHEYQYGVLSKSWYVDPANPSAPIAFAVYDVDIDASSGLVSASRDPSGYETTFEYDSAGRPIKITPQDGAYTVIDYIPFDGNPSPQVTPAQVVTTLRTTTESLSQSAMELDDFGRPTLERKQLPNSSFTERETIWDELGRLTSRSQWGDLSKTTQYLDYDAFGRVGVIRPPDGSAHDMSFSHEGDRVTTQISMRALQVSGIESPVSREVELDSMGRLRAVRELSGTPGPGSPEETTTSYSYDVGNRLTEIVSGAGAIFQTRTYQYDARGFLTGETLPEYDVPVTYSNHNVSGRPKHVVKGPLSMSADYDFMGRLEAMYDLNHSNRAIMEMAWDQAPGRGKGRVHWVEKHNYVDDFPSLLPWPASAGEDIRIRHVFNYQGLGGKTSRRDTRIKWSQDEVTFRLDQVWNDLGDLETLTYPRCISPSSLACTNSDAGQGRQVSYDYSHGWLTGVLDGGLGASPWATMTYHASGMRNAVIHANGVEDKLILDTYFKNRPRQVYTINASPTSANFNSGVMTYDGAGNLKAIGGDRYAYDKVGRITRAEVAGVYLQDYQYDRFGNLTFNSFDSQTPPFSIDSQTNRIASGANYDTLGNLLDYSAWHWRYDEQNKVTVQGPNVYAYDVYGQRIASFSTGGSLFHLRDLGGQRLSTVGQVNGNWNRHKDFIAASGRVLASEDYLQVKTLHHHPDHLGNTRLLTRPDQSVEAEFLFMPYGEDPTRGFFGSYETDVLFTGHERDSSTGAHYMHARHYHPSMGRFTSVDPYRGNPEDPQSLNRYAYTGGNPLNMTDPNGMQRIICWRDGGSTHCVPVDDEITVVADAPPTFGFRRPPINPNLDWEDPYIDINPRRNPDPGGGDEDGGGGGDDNPGNPPDRDPDGRLDCSGQTFSVLCELGNDNSYYTWHNDFNRQMTAFGYASLIGGLSGGWVLAGGLTGVGYGMTAEAIGGQAILAESGWTGMYGLANWTYGGTQTGFFASLVIRGSAGNVPIMLPGGPITGWEVVASAAGYIGGPSLYAYGYTALQYVGGLLNF